MKQLTTTITQRGQVTIPAEVRRVLGVRPRDKVCFTIKGTEVRLAPLSFTLESAYGSVEPSRWPEDFKNLARAAKDAKAAKAVATIRKMRKA